MGNSAIAQCKEDRIWNFDTRQVNCLLNENSVQSSLYPWWRLVPGNCPPPHHTHMYQNLLVLQSLI